MKIPEIQVKVKFRTVSLLILLAMKNAEIATVYEYKANFPNAFLAEKAARSLRATLSNFKPVTE